MNPRWRRDPALTWTRYDDSSDWVVYSPRSADIHLVTDSTHLLWTLIGDASPPTLDELAAVLARAMDCPVDDELLKVTRDSLAFMDHAGLIHSVSS